MAIRRRNRLRIDAAIAERPVHRSQRGTLVALASRDFAAFETVVSSTARIGYPAATAEFSALMDARGGGASALRELSAEHPDLVAEADPERRDRVNGADIVRHEASAELATAVKPCTDGGELWDEAVAIVAERQRDLIRAYTSGIKRAERGSSR